MTRHLVGFLGTGAPTNGSYRTANYRFDDGFEIESAFFGLALFRWLASQPDTRPDRLTLLGTRRSMWGALYQFGLEDDGPEPDLDEWEPIADAVASPDGIDEASLARAGALLTRLLADRGFGELQVGLRCIPYGLVRPEQVQILQVMAEDIRPGDRVWMDLTHGFRHLPMLGLLSAMHLGRARGVTLEGIYYGALEMHRERGYAPVIALGGLLELADWVVGLSSYEASGDYGVLGALMVRDGLPEKAAGGLARASFLERSAQFGRAAQALNRVRPDLAKLERDSPSALFAQELRGATRWAETPSLAEKQRAAASRALAQGRYVAAAAAALEALVTEEVVTGGGSAADYQDRGAARKALLKESKRYWQTLKHRSVGWMEWEQYSGDPRIRFHKLNQVRNALAHGRLSDESDDVKAILANERAFLRFMARMGLE